MSAIREGETRTVTVEDRDLWAAKPGCVENCIVAEAIARAFGAPVAHMGAVTAYLNLGPGKMARVHLPEAAALPEDAFDFNDFEALGAMLPMPLTAIVDQIVMYEPEETEE